MRLLLDTCTFLWLTQEPDRLSDAARRAIDNPKNELLFSHVSAWEVYLKHQAKNLKLPAKPDQWLKQQLAEWVVSELPIDLEGLAETNRLKPFHRDPFDRLLVAQARVLELQIVTPDPWISKYPVPVIW